MMKSSRFVRIVDKSVSKTDYFISYIYGESENFEILRDCMNHEQDVIWYVSRQTRPTNQERIRNAGNRVRSCFVNFIDTPTALY